MIAGKSMIQRTFERAKLAKRLTRLVVATNDERIVKAVEEFGGEARLTSSECRTGSDRCHALACALEKEDGVVYDIILNIQGDEPLVNPDHIDALIDALANDTTVPIAACAAPLHRKVDACNPNVTKVVMDNFSNAIYFSRALIPNSKSGQWSDKTTYYKNCGMYAYRHDFLARYCAAPVGPLQASEDLEQLKVLELGEKMKMVKVDSAEPGIDTPEQLAEMNARLAAEEQSSSK
eukprot:TRINITY_DN2413_c0_g1_i1.p1 TRINITY_DN2413_c0_g1~~TRINITY_DN2413_c0_g1_i1.p1  ORF type:complete len:235 (-),score=69.41 TRINITY_DN2413_c0_g1_i1:46-750(-)